MTAINNVVPVVRRPEHVVLPVKPKLIVSKELLAQITYLHSEVGDIEWSGPLYYSVISGGLDDLANLVVKAQLVLPKDVGSAAYTEYEFGTEMMDFYDKYPQVMGMKMGHIHTHHSMSTFFSGTDMSELFDNTPGYDYYVSLIVHHKGKYCAKVAILGEEEYTSKSSYADKNTGNVAYAKESTAKKQIIFTADFDIEFEQDDFMKKEIARLIAESRKYAAPVATYNNYTPGKTYTSPSTYSAVGNKVPVAQAYAQSRVAPNTGQAKLPLDNADTSARGAAMQSPRQISEREQWDEWEAGYGYQAQPQGKAEEQKGEEEDDLREAREFLARLITGEKTRITSFENAIANFNKSYIGTTKAVKVKEIAGRLETYHADVVKPECEWNTNDDIYRFIYNCLGILEDHYETNDFALELYNEFDALYDVEFLVK